MDASRFSISPQKEATTSQFFYRQLLGHTPPLASGDETDLTGKTAIVTGSNCGLGLEVARQLLGLGLAKLILAVRSESKGEAARRDLLAGQPDAASGKVEVWSLDMASYDSIAKFAQRAAALDRLDIAVLNAGVFKGEEEFHPSTGYEEDVQINYLSTALLMTMLLPALKPSPARLVIVSSDTAGWVDFKEKSSNPILAAFKRKSDKWDMQERYGTSKLLGQFYLTELANRVPASAVTIDCVNPGFCYGTELTRAGEGTVLGSIVNLVRRIIGKPTQVGALSIVHAAVSFGQEEIHGQYVEDGQIRP